MKVSFSFLNPAIIWIFICGIIVSAYWSSLTGPMVFDDQVNIVENSNVAIKDLSFASLKRAASSNNSGRLKRILPALSFGIDHYYAGGFKNTFAFKITNLAVHLINTALVFWLLYLLWPKCRGAFSDTDQTKLFIPEKSPLLPAAFAALLWALHPLQASAVVYVVQRMTSMSATFVLFGLVLFMIGRQRLAEQRPHGMILMAIGIVGGTSLGLLCKENAALLPLYAGVIEFTLFNRDTLAPIRQHRLRYFYALLLIAPLCLGLIYMLVHPGEILNGYASRPFTLEERLLTQARILWFYLYLLVMPDITLMGVFHDDIPISRGWLSPWTTLPSVIAWVSVVLCGFLLRKKNPVVAFGIFWYLGGHSMESTFIPLEMVFEHRNYLPSLGPILMLCIFGQSAAGYMQASIAELKGIAKRSARLQLAWLKTGLPVAIIMIAYGLSWTQAQYWRSENSFIASQARNHPDSAFCQYLYAEVLYKKQRNPLAAYPFYYRAAELRPNEVAFLISLQMLPHIAQLAEQQKPQFPELLDPQHTEKLLRYGPVSAWGMRALDVATNCVLKKYTACMEHQDEIHLFLTAVVSNPLTSLEMQRHFIKQQINIGLIYGRYNDALALMEQAKIRDSHYMDYDVWHAKILEAGKRYWEALQVLAAAQQKWRQNNLALFEINSLRNKIIVKLNQAPHS